jgi:hypothetical protein
MAGYSPALAVFVYVLQAMLGPVANACGKGRMQLVDYLGESRVRENLMHGLGRGCWKQGRSLQVICGSRAGVQECHLWAWSRPSLKVAATAPAPYFTVLFLSIGIPQVSALLSVRESACSRGWCQDNKSWQQCDSLLQSDNAERSCSADQLRQSLAC